MAGTSANSTSHHGQYLTVPKIPFRRKQHQSGNARTRSRSRPRDERPEAVVASPISRPHSPPAPAAETYRKPSLNGFTVPAPTTITTPVTSPAYKAPVVQMDPVQVSVEGTNYDDLSPDLNGGIYTMEQCATPPPELPLRQKLIGAWRLESYIAYPTPSSTLQRPTYPMTKNVTGFIMYTPDGYMSAQMLIPGQQSFKRGEGEDAQWTEAAKRFFAYSGPYYITNEGPGREEVLRHTFQVCNLPGWIGDIQVRTQKFEEDGQVLVLGSEEPSEIKIVQGEKRIPVLKWRRARDNTHGSPPPPTPQIKISGPGEP